MQVFNNLALLSNADPNLGFFAYQLFGVSSRNMLLPARTIRLLQEVKERRYHRYKGGLVTVEELERQTPRDKDPGEE